MLGTIVNVITILVGSSIGIIFRKVINQNHMKSIQQAIGMSVIVVGISDALKLTNILLVIGSLALGTWIGEVLGLHDKLTNFAKNIEKRFSASNFAQGFTAATLIYCVGPLSILGSIQSGLFGNHTSLYIKSLLDGVISLVLASTMGIGVAFSAIPVFLYQGSITVLAEFMSSIMVEEAVLNLSGVGGIIVMGIGLNLLKITNIKLMNMVPALIFPIIYFLIF